MNEEIKEKKEEYKKRGNPLQPKRQTYHVKRGDVRIVKRMTQTYQNMSGKTRLTPEEKSMIAFFILRHETHDN
jgi:hypothetical protein